MTYYKAKEVRFARKGESIIAKVGSSGYAHSKLEDDSLVVALTEGETAIIPISMLHVLGWRKPKK